VYILCYESYDCVLDPNIIIDYNSDIKYPCLYIYTSLINEFNLETKLICGWGIHYSMFSWQVEVALEATTLGSYINNTRCCMLYSFFLQSDRLKFQDQILTAMSHQSCDSCHVQWSRVNMTFKSYSRVTQLLHNQPGTSFIVKS